MKHFFSLFFLFPIYLTAQLHLSNPDFRLRNVDNRMISLESYPNAKGFILVFTCNHCPFAKLYSKKLIELNEKYEALGVPLLAINPMDTLVYEEESFELMQEKAKIDKFTFPYLQDASQEVAKKTLEALAAKDDFHVGITLVFMKSRKATAYLQVRNRAVGFF